MQKSLGNHWVVSHFTNRSVTFAFVEEAGDKSSCRGLYVEISKRDNFFTTRIETPRNPDFPLDGNNDGDRTRFYIDLGRLYADGELLQFIKDALREISLKAIETARESLRFVNKENY